MALPSSGSISMSQVRAELKLSGSINLGHSRVRGLAGRPSGSISMSQLRGKSDKKWVYKGVYEVKPTQLVPESVAPGMCCHLINSAIGSSFDKESFGDGYHIFDKKQIEKGDYKIKQIYSEIRHPGGPVAPYLYVFMYKFEWWHYE